MPLTAELVDQTSPILGWITTRFPHVDALLPRWSRALKGASTIYPRHDGDIDWPGIGTAFGYRLGYAHTNHPPYHAIRAIPILTGDDEARHQAAAMFDAHRDLDPTMCADLRPLPDGQVLRLPRSRYANDTPRLGAAADGLVEFFARVAAAVRRYPLHKPSRGELERSLAKAWYALGLLESVYRRGLGTAYWLPYTCSDLTSDYLLGLTPGYVQADVARLAGALTSKGLRQFPKGPAVVAPEFVACWADADLIVGDLLIDCKTTIRADELRPEWVYQLLGYALLDVADCYQIRSVGIYLARQARLITWTLDEFTSTLSGAAAPLAQLRHELAPIAACVLQGQLGAGWRRRWLTLPPL